MHKFEETGDLTNMYQDKPDKGYSQQRLIT